jgi:hypothetical protein
VTKNRIGPNVVGSSAGCTFDCTLDDKNTKKSNKFNWLWRKGCPHSPIDIAQDFRLQRNLPTFLPTPDVRIMAISRDQQRLLSAD